MELEFDKEIDALLRKSRGLDAPAAEGHLDADEVAAFVENALPASARFAFSAHLAECSRCRRILATAIRIDEPASDVVVAAPVVDPVRVPWYSKLLRFPAISYALGAMVLVFGGLLAFIAVRNNGSGEISQTFDKSAAPASKPANANSAAPANTSVMPAANTAANAPAIVERPSNSNAAGPSGPRAEPEEPKPMSDAGATNTDEDRKQLKTEDQPDDSVTLSKPVAQPTSAPVGNTAGEPGASGAGRERDIDKTSAETRSEEKQKDKEVLRDAPKMPAPAAKKRSDETPLKEVGGKTFKQIGGIWFDAAYSSQPQTSVKRGSDEYRKLDSGLRSIADQLGGTVIIVWGGKAYRIN